jgi:hypothetical protein
MQCPNCKFEHENQSTECLRCGIVFAKFSTRNEAVRATSTTVDISSEVEGFNADRAKQELRYRLFAFPVALLLARILVGVYPGLVRLLTMWVHETGHALMAWLSGFWAMPGPWFTSVSNERSLSVTLAAVAVVGFSGFQFWDTQRWPMLGAAGAVFVFQLACTRMPVDRAQALIIFGGDGGCMVLGCALMATFYAQPESAIYENSLRWGFLIIGAAAFMDPFKTWTGGEDDIPFGTQEGTLTDPSSLVEVYGWPIHVMQQRYVRLGVACLIFLASMYLIGILTTRRAMRSSSSPS